MQGSVDTILGRFVPNGSVVSPIDSAVAIAMQYQCLQSDVYNGVKSSDCSPIGLASARLILPAGAKPRRLFSASAWRSQRDKPVAKNWENPAVGNPTSGRLGVRRFSARIAGAPTRDAPPGQRAWRVPWSRRRLPRRKRIPRRCGRRRRVQPRQPAADGAHRGTRAQRRLGRKPAAVSLCES